MNSTAAQAVQPAACTIPADAASACRTALMEQPVTTVSDWRTDAIRRAAEAADRYGDEYAMTGCFSSLGAMHRADALLRRLLAGSVSV